MKTKIFLSAFLMISSFALFSQWSTDPAVNNVLGVLPGEEAIPKVATSASGITYVSWFSVESGNYNVRLQKLDVFGNVQWDGGGILISDNQQDSWLTDWDMTIDQADHAILVWNDIRTGNPDVFAYRISPEGEFVWGNNGIQISTSPGFDAAPKVTVTNAGNAVFAWQEIDAGNIIGQKIAPDGTLQWGSNGLTLSGNNTYSWPQMIPVGTDDIIMKFFEDSGVPWAPTRHVYAQRFSGSGAMVWAQPAVISNAGGISAWTQIFPFINDGSDGFYIAWHDDRDNNMLANIWVQHVGNDGTVLYAANGVEVSTMPNRNHFYAHLAFPEGSNDIFIFWNEMDPDQNNRGIYGQKVSSAGNRLWTDDGKKFIEISPLNVYPLAGQSSGSSMVLFYEEYFNAVEGKIKAMRIDTDGNYLWNPNYVDVCTVQSEKVHTDVGNFNNGQWIAAWEDSRNGGRDIYGQNLKLDGTLGPVQAGSIVVNPDTLWFTLENYESKTLTIKNNFPDPITVTYIEPFGNYWTIDPLPPSVPFEIPGNDSLNLSVFINVIVDYTSQIEGYYFDEINIETSAGDYYAIIAIDSLLIVNTESMEYNPEKAQIYPNPFHDQLYFAFDLNKATNIELTIADVQGNIILNSGKMIYDFGRYNYHWDGKTASGETVPPGIYLYKINLNDRIISGRIIKLR